MRPSAVLSGLAGLALTTIAAAAEQKAAIYIQPITAADSVAPALLAEITYDPQRVYDAVVSSFEYPEFLLGPDADDEAEGVASGEGTKLVRIGTWDSSARTWTSSTSVASATNFGKGYSPHLLLTLSESGDKVVSAALSGVAIDAGQTRDFGPQAVVRRAAAGAQVELNKPVVVTPGGAGAQQGEPEKTFLQKYWWAIGIVVLLSLTGGGDAK
ncbi:hypothetical protein BX600DRAFT_449720 [Xylariales sp. PMI_506]|nr:hypothetical protein BX600DRAFT_449720 [Xylariales sp. PMI_506]